MVVFIKQLLGGDKESSVEDKESPVEEKEPHVEDK